MKIDLLTEDKQKREINVKITFHKRLLILPLVLIAAGILWSFSMPSDEPEDGPAVIDGKDYDFNRLVPVVFAPDDYLPGQDVELQVAMMAFDTENTPVIEFNGEPLETRNGVGVLTVPTSGFGKKRFEGTIKIKDKKGVEKKFNWHKIMHPITPLGSITLPEMNIIYRGYSTKVSAIASGYDATALSATGVMLTADGENQYIARAAGSAKEALFTISGKSTVTGKTVALAKYAYSVRNLPEAHCFLGDAGSGTITDGKSSKITVRLGNEMAIKPSYEVLSWELQCAGTDKLSGEGSKLSTEALAQIKQTVQGKLVSLLVSYKGTDGVLRTGSLVLRKG